MALVLLVIKRDYCCELPFKGSLTYFQYKFKAHGYVFAPTLFTSL